MSRAADDESERLLDTATALQILSRGDLEPLGPIPWSSNYALLTRVCLGDQALLAVYKPRRGERPLWDFPDGTLYLREYAAYVLAMALGWELIPPTVLRSGPYGPGTLQAYIESDPEQHYFNIFPRHADDFRRIALFDVVANNADRKAGHCLLDARGRMWSIDHGLCFHVEPKLRTVIWDFAGEPIPAGLLEDLCQLAVRLRHDEDLQAQLAALLSRAEIRALQQRLEALIASGRFPHPDPRRRNHPWPPI
ncbi:MAG: SCO1664 family protein [Caldilineales bacterium]|nr:SCO1664 family protein [Caldilineales bacterium]